MVSVIYANALARSKEKSLIGLERFNRMIESQNIDEAIKILSEVNFGGDISLGSSMEFEKMLSNETHMLFDFIKKECPSETLKRFILTENDFHNAQALVYEKYLKKDAEVFKVEDGLFSFDDLKSKIMKDEYDGFSDGLKNALKTCDELFVSKKANGANVGAVFTKFLFFDLYKISKFNHKLKKALKIKIDCANISACIRLNDFEKFAEYFIEHGNFDCDDLRVFCEKSVKDAVKYFSGTDAYDFLSAVLGRYKEGEPLSELEKYSDSYIMKVLVDKKYEQGSITPFMQYCYYKLSDIDNARIILVGIVNNQDKEKIKERLRKSYER